MRFVAAALALWAGAAAHHTSTAAADWPSGTSGAAAAKATSMPTGAQPTASVSNRSVTVSWPQSNIASGPAVDGYVVKRYSAGGSLQSIGSGCSGTITGLSCTEESAPSGSWRYAVVPKHGNWLGTEGPLSATVTVAAASLSVSPTTATSLPATLTGSLASFIPDQTVTYRLDDPANGTVLDGNITPNRVQNSGEANVSVTIPTGTPNGSHTVYAIGSSGDIAGATITLNVAVPLTLSTSAWDVRDASAGGSEVNSSSQIAFASDSRTVATGAWTSAFGTRYVEFDMNDPLQSGQTVSGAAFNFRFAAAGGSEQACFYFELRRISTDEVVSTHGSATTPAGCVTGTTQTTVTTNLPALNTSSLANDVRIRVYARESASKLINLDLASVTGSAGSTPFTLYAVKYADATATPATTRWGPATSGDNSAFTTAANWASSFSATRYLKVTFPAYVPSGATVTGATFENQYRPSASGRSACWYAEVYAGATLIKTVGSSSSPISCNSSASYTTDTISIPEVNTPARANSLSVRLYYNISGSGTRTTQHDLMKLSVAYSQ